MKLLQLSFFTVSIFAQSDIFENENEANSVLRSKRGVWDILGTVGPTDANQRAVTASPEELQRQKVENFIETYHLTSVEAWEELKETMEKKSRADVPEEKVDELETCVSKCKRRERWLRFSRLPGDKSIMEQKQNQEEAYEKSCEKGRCDDSVFKKLIPCPKCFRYIPAVSNVSPICK